MSERKPFDSKLGPKRVWTERQKEGMRDVDAYLEAHPEVREQNERIAAGYAQIAVR